MQVKKTALVRHKESSSWTSCKTITENLQATYQNNKNINITKVVEISNDDTFSMYEKGFELSSGNYDLLVFLDHFPCPANLITALDSFVKNDTQRPDIIIHVFGDFILQSPQWLAASEILKNYQIKFINASTAQSNLLKKLIVNHEGIENAFFPIATNSCNFSDTARKKIRKTLDIHEEKLVFIYTGRLSMQKNVIELISFLSEARNIFSIDFELLVAGPFDDIGIPYIGQYSQNGTYCSRWVSHINSKKFVRYLGNLNSKELHEAYCASDCFVSLSTHNDEDFGISPCEAASTGLPLILSNWGGYFSFPDHFDNCHLVDVDLESPTSVRPMPSKKHFIKVLLNFIEQKDGIKRTANPNCSTEALTRVISSLLDNMHTSKFQGFTDLMIKTVARFSATPTSPFSGAQGAYSTLYYELYDTYINGKDHDIKTNC